MPVEEKKEVIKDIDKITPKELLNQYQTKFDIAKVHYKEAMQDFEDAFDEYDEECAEENMAKYKVEVKKCKSEMIALIEENPDLKDTAQA